MSLARRFAIDARLLEAWLIEVLEPMPQTAAPVAWPEPAQAKPVPSVPGVAEKPADRMIVVREPGFMGAAELASAIDDILAIDYHPPVYQKVFEGNWIEGRGVRFRINFFDIYGVTSASASGFWVRLSRQPARFIPAGVPAYIRGSYPIYFHHDLARAEVEVQNTGTAPITGLQAAVRQETVTDNGQAGKPITNAVALEFPGALAPGQTASFPYQFRLEGPGNERINFEQSHLVVTSDAGVLADEAKAALVDPPNF
jgi:hypothetical protein